MRGSSSTSPARAGLALAGLAAALLSACSGEPQWHEQRRFAMGTWVDTIHRTADDAATPEADNAVDALLQRFEIDYYAWADGELGHLNAALAAGETFTASAELTELLERARNLSRISEGFFDPGVGALVEAWGFHSADAEPREPAPEFLDAWNRSHPTIADLQIDGRRISADATPLVVDLGGIAKGEVVDRMLARYRAAGISDVLVNAGGDVRVSGMRGERNWTIGIQAPRAGDLLGSIPLEDGEAAFTSGDYERFFDTDAGRRHHLIDPISGRPAAHTQAVTVIADNGALADAAATAIFVAGPQNWRRIAAALGVTLALRVDAGGRIEMTPAMRERVRMQGAGEPATMHEAP